MNEEYEIKKIVKTGAKVGGVWGFVNGLFLILIPTLIGAIIIGGIAMLIIISKDFI